MQERRFQRDISALEAIFAFVDEFLGSRKIDSSQGFEAKLVIEELFANMVKYANGTHEVSIALEHAGSTLTIVLQDFDVDSFDMTLVATEPVDVPLEERRAGGMGIHLVRRIADTIRYQYSDRTSTITLTKRLAS